MYVPYGGDGPYRYVDERDVETRIQEMSYIWGGGGDYLILAALSQVDRRGIREEG